MAGSARVDITPSWPVMLGGFGQRTTPSAGVHDHIFGKALYLTNAGHALLLVTADLICIPQPLGGAVIAAIGDATGLTPDQICICASHTHSAPAPYDAHDGAAGVAQYVQFLQHALADVGLAAIANAQPCRLRTGVGAVDLFRNRRTRGNPNIVDSRVAVLAAEHATSGQLLAVLFGVGCHPVTLGWDNMSISGDFAGYAQTTIEQRLGVPNALFFNTTEGNVIPLSSPNLDALDPRGYCGGSFADTVELGTAIAHEVVRVVAASVPHDDVVIASRRADLQILPNYADLTTAQAAALYARCTDTLVEYLGADFERAIPQAHLWSVASQRVIEDELSEADMRALMIACCLHRGLGQRLKHPSPPRTVAVPLLVMRINDFDLLALPGEVLVEVGQEWSRRVGSASAFIIGLANAHQRYLPRAAHFAEADADVRYETVTAGLAPNGVEIILDEATTLLSQLRAHAT